jgi:hypothetical protein
MTQPGIWEVKSAGALQDAYSVDESQAVSNAGDAEIYLYEGKRYEVITWNNEAMEHEDGDRSMSELFYEYTDEEDCKKSKLHLTDCDNDGFCNHCGNQ